MGADTRTPTPFNEAVPSGEESHLPERWSAQRRAELMPYKDQSVFRRVSLGESHSPLLEALALQQAVGLPKLMLKMDSHLPTGSLKDRPISVVVAGALDRGASAVAASSSGNAGASIATHAAKAGIRAVMGLLAGAPAGKLGKIRVRGPTVVQVVGGMDDAEVAIRSLSKRGGWFIGDAFINPYALEGEKTIALKVAIQTGWNPPDAMVFPLGNAACLVASYKGFQELKELRCISRTPRLIGAQFSACMPIAKAFEEGGSETTRFRRTPSFSSTLMHEDPVAGTLALRVIRETGGCALGVADDEVREAMRFLPQKAGSFAEPAGAIALAGAIRLGRQGILKEGDRVACLVTGTGLNQVHSAEPTGRMTEPLSLEAVEAMSPSSLLA